MVQKFIKEFELRTPQFEIKVVESEKDIVDTETKRVLAYLGSYTNYERIGKHELLRFPSNVIPHKSYDKLEIASIVQDEYLENKDKYETYCDTLRQSAQNISSIIPVVQQIYGQNVGGIFRIMPTSYGPIASSTACLGCDTTVLRIPQFIPETIGGLFTTGKYRSPVELLTHELLVHKVTTVWRQDSLITEVKPRKETHWYKEYLMELLGIEILTQSGLMSKQEIAIQNEALCEAQNLVDPIYYGASGISKWIGNVVGLISEIDSALRNKSF